ncbi:MAG: hypothetical protein AT710_05115 [Thermocladium sp. ECH_B]|nr:MAG: hypothetical protein AT710_05115 [Thermocladium sp. ECH_B]
MGYHAEPRRREASHTAELWVQLLLQGPAPYAEGGGAFLLGEDNVRWLSQVNNPRVFGGEYTSSILVYPPRPRRVFVKLEPVKG